MRWAIILPLKNMAVNKHTFQARTGVAFGDQFRERIERLKEHGLLYETESTLALTHRGRFFADEICQQFESTAYRPFPVERYEPGPLSPYRLPEYAPRAVIAS